MSDPDFNSGKFCYFHFCTKSGGIFMCKKWVFLFFAPVFLLAACESKPPVSLPEPTTNADIETLPVDGLQFDLLQLLPPAEWEALAQEVKVIADPVFKADKIYRAIPLSEIWTEILPKLGDTTGMQVDLVCADGYAPTMPLSKMLSGTGFLAFRDQEMTGKQPWSDSLLAKFEPFYLVWPEVNGDTHHWSWPYGLTLLRFKSFEEAFAGIFPVDAPAVQPGFQLFKETFLKCHSINKIGGNMGPELNFPKNITAYWQKEDIWSFIRHPQSFRYNSKMPGVPTLEREQFEAIYAYLQYIGQQPVQ